MTINLRYKSIKELTINSGTIIEILQFLGAFYLGAGNYRLGIGLLVAAIVLNNLAYRIWYKSMEKMERII